MPTSRPRHSITETPALAEVLEPLRARLGANAPTLGELVRRRAEVTLRRLDARETFLDRLRAGSQPDLDAVHRIRHATRHP